MANIAAIHWTDRTQHPGTPLTGAGFCAAGAALLGLLLAVGTVAAATRTVPSTDRVPDLTGTYDIATITPLERPEQFGESLVLSPAIAAKMAADIAAYKQADLEVSDPDREAPPKGGDGSTGAAGNVGGYNTFWIDNGDAAFRIDGDYRTSILTEPADGRRPAMTPAATARAAARRAMFRDNKGDAWWVGEEGPGPYDDPESRTLSDRCLLGFGSTGGPPMLPTL
ncbi:MAG: hypothetical protein KDI31_13450, partial [Pseudomonadales bacterium]|nr:hypothetical protein [Pseudomonadales bacterium]